MKRLQKLLDYVLSAVSFLEPNLLNISAPNAISNFKQDFSHILRDKYKPTTQPTLPSTINPTPVVSSPITSSTETKIEPEKEMNIEPEPSKESAPSKCKSCDKKVGMLGFNC